jgi:DNA-binding transcriptional ArsR family regulator
MRSLPPALKRSIAAFSFAYRRHIPDLFSPSPDAELPSFDAEVAALSALDDDTIALEFSRPLWDHGGRRDAAHLKRDEVRAHIECSAAAMGADPKIAALVYEDPRELAKRFVGFIRSYWEHAFAEEWARVEPLLAQTVAEIGQQIASEGLYDFLRSVSLRLRVDADREEFGVDLPHDHRVDVTPDRPLLLVPSVYVWPHVRVNCDEPWPLSIVYPAPFLARSAHPPLPSGDLVQLLRALGEQTRLRALKLIAERPRSTQELAPLVGISEAGLSKHLRQLADAGLVEARREGYYVLYSLVPERIEPLSDALRRFLSE